MTGFRQSFARHRRLAAAVIGLALAMRALLPAGWMPASVPGQLVELCTGMGSVTAWLDADGTLHKSGKPQTAQPEQPCAFAGNAIAFAPADAAEFVVAVAQTSQSERPFQAAVGQGLAAPPPHSRAPPVLI